MPKRYEWIDNARVIAALMIMYMHIPICLDLPKPYDNHFVSELLGYLSYHGRVPFFLILAGYFLSRNISWKKAWNRFIWLLIPYVVWNLVAYSLYNTGAILRIQDPSNSSFNLLGIGSFFVVQWGVADPAYVHPIIGPSWFLRDIMLLALLTPLLVRLRKVIPFLLLLFVLFRPLNMPPLPGVTLSLGSCVFYLLGVWLKNFSIPDAYRLFNARFTPFLILGIPLAVVVVLKNNWIHGETPFELSWTFTILAPVFGAMLIAHGGVLIEQHLPKLSSRMSKLAPACFLTFMLHMLFYDVLTPYLPKWFLGSYWGLLIPLPLFVLIVLFYFALKRYTPFLLPYVAHVQPNLPKISPRSDS